VLGVWCCALGYAWSTAPDVELYVTDRPVARRVWVATCGCEAHGRLRSITTVKRWSGRAQDAETQQGFRAG
jgi:hypothetical protein